MSEHATTDTRLGLAQILDLHLPHLRWSPPWPRRARLLRPQHLDGRL